MTVDIKRTGKFGIIYTSGSKPENEIIDRLMKAMREKIDDGRRYVVTVGTCRLAPEFGSLFEEPHRRRARLLIWLRKWRDAEVGEFCEIPGEQEYAMCEVETIDNPFHDDVEGSCKTRKAWTLEGRTFIGALAGWMRIE